MKYLIKSNSQFKNFPYALMFEKHPGKGDIQDNLMLSTKYPARWRVLMDKGYQGTQNTFEQSFQKRSPMVNFYLLMTRVGTQPFQVIVSL